jgi:DNA-binding PadR family transcriptional regulator
MCSDSTHTAGDGPFGHAGAHGGDYRDVGVLRMAMSHRGPGRHGPGRGRHRRGFGGGPEGGFGGFGFGPGGPGGGRGRGRKARRGDIRTAALLLLAEEPRNGYQIMQEVEQRSDGVWRPSPGSVYPALQQLEDEGLIRSQESDGRKLFALTDAGQTYVQERGSDKPAPWEQMSGDVSDEAHQLGRLMRELAIAFGQVMHSGGPAQLAQAREVLSTARRDLYRILADGEPESEG